MTTGDLKNNLRKLQGELKAVSFNHDVDFESLGNGNTADYLPIYHYVFIEYSRPLSAKIAEINVELFGKTDLRFIESVYKVLREVFAYKPPVTKQQFFAPGFGERKVIMCTQILQLMRVKHQSLVGSSKSTSVKLRSTQALPSPALSSTPFGANSEIVRQTLQTDSTVTERLIPGPTTTVVPLVVNEIRTRSVSEVPLVPVVSTTNINEQPQVTKRNADFSSMAPGASSNTDERKRQADDAIKFQLLEAFGKINGSIEQISSRLGTLDHRLARLESLEQRLAGIDRLETRIADVEETVLTNVARETIIPSADDDQNSNKLDLVTSQLNNLVARMTLVENKLVMLQSTELSVEVGHPKLLSSSSSSPRLKSLSSDRTNHSSEVNQYIDLNSATESQMTVGTATPPGSLSSNEESKSTRVDQLDRIQAMLRGTAEMLNMNSANIEHEHEPSPSLT